MLAEGASHMVSGWVKDSHRCGLPLQRAAPTQAFKMLPPPLPHLSWQISTQSHPSPPPRLPCPSITAWTHWNTQPAAAFSSRQSLTSEQGFLRAQMLIAIPLPVFFSKKMFFFWFYHVSFFFSPCYPFQSCCDGSWIYCQVFCERWNSSEWKSESVGRNSFFFIFFIPAMLLLFLFHI